MTALKVTNFLGILPKIADRLLPDTAAVQAENLNLTSGEIRPVRPASEVYVPGGLANYLAAYRAAGYLAPALNLEFAGATSLDPRITFSRPSIGTYFGSDGLLKTAANDVARFGCDPLTRVSKGLLIEESRTNALVYSEQFDNALWGKSRTTITANAAIAPDGNLTADKLVEDSTPTNDHYISQAVACTLGNTYVKSVFVKAAERTKVSLRAHNTSGTFNTTEVLFDLAAASAAIVTGTPTGYGIQAVGNDWFRVWMSVPALNSASGNITLNLCDATGSTYTGNGTSGAYIWGVQWETGAFPTSYIPTVAAPVTRAADVASMTGANFSAWFRQDEGTFVAVSDFTQGTRASDGATVFCVDDSSGTANHVIGLLYSTNATPEKLWPVMWSSGANQLSFGQYQDALLSGASNTLAYTYKANNVAVSGNGLTVSSDTTAVLPLAQNALRLGAYYNNANRWLNGHIARLTYYPRQLPGEVLQSLSDGTYSPTFYWENWRCWTVDVDVAKAALSADVETRYYWTGDGCPRYTTFTNFNGTEYALGIPNPAAKPTATPTGGTGATLSRSYCYTFYQPATGEESGPSPFSDIVSGKVDGTWTVSGFSNTPANDRTIPYNTAGLYQRLYRTAGNSADIQLVAERPVSTANWVDTLTDAQIMGDSLITAGWEPPPVNLKGLTALPNGSMVGFNGNELCFSEPYQPHSWPLSYRYQTESLIVGIANVGTLVVAATQTRPYLADGVTPDAVTVQSVDNVWPCLSKRSVCSIGDAVIYATKHGLALVGPGGASIFTQQQGLYTQEEWAPLNPASMVTATSGGRIFIAHTPASAQTRMLMIYPGEAAVLTTYALSPNELYTDPLDGQLYLVGKTVSRWDDGTGERMMFNWLSKEFEIPDPVNFGAAQVDFETTMQEADIVQALADYNAKVVTNTALISSRAFGAFNQDAYNVTAINAGHFLDISVNFDTMDFSLYANGVEVCHRTLTSAQPFRLPAGYKARVIQFRLVGNMRVRSVKLAETMMGLKQV